ncbi:MAG: YdcF family protein [Candidatus Thiodiazotropha sp.]
MQFDPERGAVDWDGFFTFLLTLLLLSVTLGIPLLMTLRLVLRTARSARATTTARQLLVFGKQLRKQQIDDDYRWRLLKAVELMRDCPDRRLLLLGGSVAADQLSESAAGERFMLEQGVPQQALVREEQSQNTLENLRHARDLLRGLSDEPVALISNRYHLARIGTMAVSLGIHHQLCAAESRYLFSWRQLPRLLMEAWYILWFRTGKRWARLIHSQRMLDRVT